jgi:hypothetical protein
MLYDKPDEVNRLAREFYRVSRGISKELGTLTPSARGYSTWGGMYAPIPWEPMQCDFSAMISLEHFERFVKWNLELTVSESPRYNYYHLDGTGQLIHLDSILSIPDLKCVQWVPEPSKHISWIGWADVYRKISDAGKNIWFNGGLEDIEKIADKIGTTKGLFWHGNYDISEYDRVMKITEKLKIK